MYSNLSIDELVERSQETDGVESNALKREIARRFREGIGVNIDFAEAEYWEGLIRNPEFETVQAMISDVKDEGPEFADMLTAEECAQMNARELYRAYRTGDPWASYYFALHMIAEGESRNAIGDLEDLIDRVERSSDGGRMPANSLYLLAQSKLQLGRLYEECFGVDGVPKAVVCYEEAALELGYSEAVPDLIRLYAADDIAAHEKQLLPLLQKMEEESVEKRMFVAELYRQIGRKVFAIAVYQDLLLGGELSAHNTLVVTKRLMDFGVINGQDLHSRSEKGEAAATYWLGVSAYETGNYAESQRLLLLCGDQDDRMREHCAPALANIDTFFAQRQAAEDAARREAEQLERERIEKEACERKEKRKERLILAIVVVVVVLVFAVPMYLAMLK